MPQRGQEKQEFVSRCMSNATMKNEFENEKQRAAICHSKYESTKRIKGGLDRDTPVSWDDIEFEIDNYPYIFY